MSSKFSQSQLTTYHIGRGETGVFQYEPYKSALLPHWCFKTVAIAKTSSSTLYQKFLGYYDEQDFVGMDMARKFIQMGMTRAKRYANYQGGRKFVDGKANGRKIEKSAGHKDKEEKEKASLVFRETWEKCKAHEGYQKLKDQFLREQKAWERSMKKGEESLKVEEEETPKVKEDKQIKVEGD
jgi:hypothetical protein